MLKKLGIVLVGLLLCVGALFLFLHHLGAGKEGKLIPVGQVSPNERPMPNASVASDILFGDLHVHTDYSADASLFNLPVLSGFGGTTPVDACNYARYCSAIDFWSINDHAEDITPRSWQNTVAAIDACNAVTDQKNPDLVAFLGWEWSQRSQDAQSHYGHKNVILREYKEGRIPTRPIAAHSQSFVPQYFPQVLRGFIKMGNDEQAYDDFNALINEISATPICANEGDVRDLPNNCREVAQTPTKLYQKLDQWGFDNLIIPHGLSWGTTNPEGVDLKNQLAEHDQNRQKLLEVYSGHGSSEQYIGINDFLVESDGSISCPQGNEQYTPCCRQAGDLAKAQCLDNGSAQCSENIIKAQLDVANLYAQQKTVSLADIGGTTINDWGQCGQLKTFMPAYDYRNKHSAQYAYTINGELSKTDTDNNTPNSTIADQPNRYRFGLIGSSDNHKARAGNGYKEGDRTMITDTKDVGVVKNQLLRSFTAKREGSFYYSGGLVAAHSQGRNRDAIWQALNERNVYGTSGERILLWFDLLNSARGQRPMGSETQMEENPKFRVSALGAFKQKAGCPDYAIDALGETAIEQLCGGECYNPSDVRKKISRIEVVRIFPQQSSDETVSGLIEDPWKTYNCASTDETCVFEFEDSEYKQNQREVLYYVRAIQAPTLAVNGDPFHCERDSEGQCIKVNYCAGSEASRDNDCLSPASERAWSSPIFIEPAKTFNKAVASN